MPHAKSVLRDSTHVTADLTNLPSEMLNSVLLLTADVESLYTNMDWKHTVDAVELFLDEIDHPQA